METGNFFDWIGEALFAGIMFITGWLWKRINSTSDDVITLKTQISNLTGDVDDMKEALKYVAAVKEDIGVLKERSEAAQRSLSRIEDAFLRRQQDNAPGNN